jgi:hypothetical protein
MRNIDTEALAIARQYAQGQPHLLKVVECVTGRKLLPAWRVYVKVGGKRGKHVATIICLDRSERFY